MRRLTAGPALAGLLRNRLQQLRGEQGQRGGIAVAMALMMPLVFGAAALAIDTSAVWSARQQVETGADAAALAVAMDCANGDCGDIKATSEAAMWANDRAAKLADLGPGIGLVSVDGNARTVSQTITTPWVINHFFAAALGYGSGQLSVQSSAAWGPAAGATSTVPLAVSWCDYSTKRQAMNSSTPTTLSLTTAGSSSCPLDAASVPAGTSLTTVDSGAPCSTTSTWKGSVKRSPGGALPSGCTATYLSSLVGTNVVIPVWDSVSGTSYHVYGYSAFHVTAVSTTSPPVLSGYFTHAAHQVDATTPPSTAAPDLGARSVFLTPSS